MLSALFEACSSSKHVPQGKYLLDKIRINISDSSGILKENEMINFVRQQPNHKVLWGTKLQLGIYNLSGRDSSKWYNRWIRKMGQAPVVYDSALTEAGASQLRKAMINKGFLNASVKTDTSIDSKKRKITVDYSLEAGRPHIIRNIQYKFPNTELEQLILSDSGRFVIQEGDRLDRTLLESEQSVILDRLHNKGYYAFGKEYVTFSADTTEGSYDVDLTVIVNPPYAEPQGGYGLPSHVPYVVRKVIFVTDYDPVVMTDLRNIEAVDTIDYRNIEILSSRRHNYLRPSVLWENCFIKAGQTYNAKDVDRTYEALSRLSILNFINIRFIPTRAPAGEQWLDAYILLTPGKSQSVSLELEGTNSEGDFGVAASIAYTHRNVGKGSETLSAKFRGAYEALSGNLQDFIHNRYMEYSLETAISFPKFKLPFLKESFKQKIKATTDFNISINYQERPEYTRVIATGGWSYRWTERFNRNRHIFTPIDINYVYLPESTNNFIDQIAPDNPLLRYSYEDHFIMRLGYTFYYTNKWRENALRKVSQKDIITLRVSAETAGNFLFAMSSIFNHRPDFHTDPYKVFGIRYSQYAKAEADFSYTHIFDHRNSIALHAGAGIGIPYGNSSILPFEKRFYGGGANGVRGWAVRTLGPGSFASTNSVTSFINQCGDIRLEMNAEYRAKLFWMIELGAFIDIGNIWTIRDYKNQPGGVFKFNKFYRQLAAAYGIGIRLDFNYFLLRLDLGMKAHNPAEGQEHWPIIHPHWGRDKSLHFSIGYPF